MNAFICRFLFNTADAFIRLTHFMDFTYYVEGCYVEMYVGKLNKPVEAAGGENDLCWPETDCDFFDMTKYAGEGNMGHG